ncbi:MAG: exosortase/archaeosortase family protein [Chthonomonadales bacterium]|nr:exosortase/archaeosortase family protein [Chthonomonadales bacterium]
MSVSEVTEAVGAPAAAEPRASARAEVTEALAGVRRWPLAAKLAGLCLLALYVPVIRETAQVWMENENHAHGVFILPVAAAVLWLERRRMREAVYRPTAWGIVPLVFGLALEAVGYLGRVKFVAMASLVPTLAGALLLLHGRDLWRVWRFAVLFLLFAAPLPEAILSVPSTWVQSVSTRGATAVMSSIGYDILRSGNVIEVPGMSLQVAEACSGYKKLTALVAFALLYGFMFAASPLRRVLLVAGAVPIAVFANVLRVAGLIAVASAGGQSALHIAHDWAEMVVLVVAFFLFVLFGKLVGCGNLRYSR